MGSLPGTRLAAHLRMPTSATTLLRLERAASVPTYSTPRVLGVDDWAFRKGHRYGTILLDLEQHRVVDVLPDRTSQSLATWLQEHTGVEIVSRDRAGAYAEGARQGAPQAIQVADRWHLVRNLGQALESLLDTRRSLLRQAVEKASAVETASDPVPSENREEPLPESEEPAGKPPKVTRPEQRKQCHRQERLDRYLQVQQLYRQGLKVSSIARQMRLDPKTVRKYLRSDMFIDRKERAPQKRGRMLDAYGAYLRQRWDGGCHNVAQLYRELTEQGYGGGYTSVKDYVKVWRQPGLADTAKRPPRVSPRQVVYWMLRKAEDRSARQQRLLEQLDNLCEPFRVARDLTRRFLAFIRQAPRTEQSQEFRSWLCAALACDVAEMRGYAAGLQQDQAAVEAGLSLPWSNGPVEGSVNRLKFVKRRGYGRANFDLLRRRVLQPT